MMKLNMLLIQSKIQNLIKELMTMLLINLKICIRVLQVQFKNLSKVED